MLRQLQQKVASSVSSISPPTQYVIKQWLNAPLTEARYLEITKPSVDGIQINMPSAQISNNACLQIVNTIIEAHVVIEDSADLIRFTIRNIADEEQIDIRKDGSYNVAMLSTAPSSIDLLHTETNIQKIELPDILSVSIFKPTTELSLTASKETYDIPCNDFLRNSFSITDNLFQLIGRRNTEGKNYGNGSLQHEQMSIFQAGIRERSPQVEKIRKAYTVERTTNSVHIRKRSVWDLLYPLLQPPLVLALSEQFDLYKQLFGYQQEGVQFLMERESALLADEMGTGKTVQTIIALRLLFRQGKIKNALILCPRAIVGSAQLSLKTGQPEGWDGHLFHWAPELNDSVTVIGGNRSQEQRELDWSCPAHVYITTFDTLRTDIEKGFLKQTDFDKFDCIVVDEAQNIKNKAAGRAKAVRKLRPKFRWALTGTPIENKIEDVISIFGFVKPKLFTKQDYPTQEVKKRIQPFFLRRLKQDVMKDLPEKVKQEEWLELDADQRDAYDTVFNKGRIKLEESVKNESEFQVRAHIFHLLTKLKQICNYAPHKKESPKTNRLIDLIETISANNEKVLVFSQYDDYGLKRLEKLLCDRGIGYVTYRGGMSDRERNDAVWEFRKNPKITVFLGAVRAAGVGMTLTEASYVIHFDHWWNPAVMWRAEDRAHRHGQKNKLTVYSFWMQDTIEERIKEKLRQKGLLIENVINSLAVEAIEEMISTDEWLEMLGVKQAPNGGATGETADTIETVIEKLAEMSPIKFEEISKDFFVNLGYANARVTQQSRDGGIDVYGTRVINNNEEIIVAQCKRTNAVGVSIARELLGVMADNENITKGFLITSGDFSDDCVRFAAANQKINLINGLTFANYLRQFKLI